jgi:LysR family glycine cleavage system transcriptional activator
MFKQRSRVPKQLPPLNGLRAFEAAARHMSFSKAAKELHVTTAAISHSIRALEDYLEIQLFHRSARALKLTERARASQAKLAAGFGYLSEAVHELRRVPHRAGLRLWLTPSFAVKWLVPRLHGFAQQHPEVDLQISAEQAMIENPKSVAALGEQLRTNEVNLAVVFGYGSYPGYVTEKLLDVSAVPLCSPTLMEGEHALRSPADLAHHTLLHDETEYEGHPTWERWLKSTGVDTFDTRRGFRFNHVALALEAAADGQGVALGLSPLAARDLAAGKLIVPFGPSLPLDRAYYLVRPDNDSGDTSAHQFRDWLLSKAKTEMAVA